MDTNLIDTIPIENITPELLASFRTAGMNDIAAALENRLKPKSNKYLDMFITQDESMIEMKRKALILSTVGDPVMIMGPTGTGKELIARGLHGDKSTSKFLAINCAGMPETLIESELFGHRAGSFTGAASEKIGLLEAAKDGSIFLDEIGELPISTQAKLLRAVQENTIRRVGANNEISINCRFIAATHRNLEKMVEDNLFREDLYYRLTTFILRTSALMDRPNDIKLIIDELDVDSKIATSEEALERFCNLIIPARLNGNVRSLQQIIRRFYVLGELPK